MMETTSLLLTKFHPPAARPQWVLRERLHQRLDDLLAVRLTVVSAPPGYGKTTLVAGWLQSARDRARAAWLSLSEGENDPVRFWAYVVGAVQEALRSVLPDSLPGDVFTGMIRSPQAPPIENALVGWLNELAVLSQSVILVLDDYQFVTNESIHQQVRFFIENMPATLHLVLVTRSEPPFPLARYRVRGWLVEVRSGDLRFTLPEAEDFLRRNLRAALPAGDVAALEERTEGWIAGLQMAVVSLAGRDSPEAFIQNFRGDDRYVLDYLTEEVLHQQSFEVVRFLLYTSLLERFHAGLCAEMLQIPEPQAQALLDELDRSNLFIIPLDNRRGWYRYHPLFAELLRSRLEQSHPERVEALHRLAAAWLGSHGLLDDALRHAFLAGDIYQMIPLLEERMTQWVELAEIQTIQSWLNRFPQEAIRQHAMLCLGCGWIALYQARFFEADQWAVQAQQVLGENDRLVEKRSFYQMQIDLIRATVAINHKDCASAVVWAERALPHVPEHMQLLRGLLYLNLGDAYRTLSRFSEAAEAFRQAYETAHASGNPFLEVVIIGSLGELYMHRGQLRQAEEILQQALMVEKDARQQQGVQGGGDLLAVGKPLYFLAGIYLEWNQLEKALAMAERAVMLCRGWGHPVHYLDSLLRLAEIRQLVGDARGARQAIDQAYQFVDPIEPAGKLPADIPPDLKQAYLGSRRWRVEQAEMLFLFWEGNLEEVTRRLQQAGVSEQNIPEYFQFDSRKFIALYWLKMNRPELALPLLLQLSQQAAANHWRRNEVDVLVKLVMAYYLLGQQQQAIAALRQAVAKAASAGYMRVMIAGGEVVRNLLSEIADWPGPAERAYAAQLMAAFPVPVAKVQPPSLSPVEPLTEREAEILRLLAADRTYPEMAALLYLSLNTVKTHVKRLYAKLGVDSRMAAVEVGHKLGMIQ